MPLRVTHLPVNFAGIPWTNVEALRRRGVDARLVVFERSANHPDADVDLRNPATLPMWRRQPIQWRALARLLPQTDIFHFYFGITLVPKVAQFPILRATGRKSVFHYLGSDIRRKPRRLLAYGRRANAQIVGSYDAQRWVPEAAVVPPGIDLRTIDPAPLRDDAAPVRVLHASQRRWHKGTDRIIAVCEELPVELDVVEGLHHAQALERYRRADVVIDQLQAGWYGVFAIEAMALGKPVLSFLEPQSVARTEEAFQTQVPIVQVNKKNLVEKLRPLIDSAEERRRLGAASRAYVEHVHDADKVADLLLRIYAQL